MSDTATANTNESSTIKQRLNTLNITLPASSAPPGAAYVPYTVSNNTVVISGQLPLKNGEITVKGQLGNQVSLEEGQQEARTCAINVLSHLKEACGGNLDKVKQFVKLEILVSATAEFTEPHIVANGASELILEIFGDKGKHARVAYGVSVLPMNVAVEVAATVEIE